MVGRPRPELPGVSVLDLLAATDRAAIEQALAEVRGGAPTQLEVGLHAHDGRVVWARVALTARVHLEVVHERGIVVGARRRLTVALYLRRVGSDAVAPGS